VLGLAYKEDTASTKNSPSLALLAAVPDLAIRAFDPVVPAEARFHPRVAQASDALDACAGADALAIMTSWRIFRSLDPAEVTKRMRGRLVLDPYRVLDGAAFRARGFDYRALGVSDA
jgi:UDPglucose 6-dehydrogenase